MSTTTNKTENHHYVPIFLLRRFTEGGQPTRVWVHERGRSVPYRKTPRRIGALPDFYAVETSSGLGKSDVEKLLGDLESRVPPIIMRLERKEVLSDAERESLAIFVAFAYTRIPRFKRIVDDVEEQVARKFLLTLAVDVARLKTVLDRVEKDSGEKAEVPPEELREFILDENRYKIVPHRHSSISAMLHVSTGIAPYILDMHWMFWHAAGRALYITSDAPVVVADPTKGPSGFGMPGAELTFPLTPCLLFVANWRYRPPSLHVDVEDDTVRAVNRRTIAFHDRYLFSSSQHIDR